MNSLTLPPSPNWYEPDIMACAPDNTIIYGSADRIVIIYNKPFDQPADIKLISHAHLERVTGVVINPDWDKTKLLLSVGADKFVRLWNCDTLEQISSHCTHTTSESRLVGATFAGADKVISVSEDGLIAIWRYSSGEITPLKHLLGIKIQVTAISSCPHATWLTAFGLKNGQVVLADMRKTGSVKYKLRGHDRPVLSLAWCPAPVNFFPKPNVSTVKLETKTIKMTSDDNSEVLLEEKKTNEVIDLTEIAEKKPAENKEQPSVLPEGSNSNGVIDLTKIVEEKPTEKKEQPNVCPPKASTYDHKKKNPWLNLKHADDDEIQEEIPVSTNKTPMSDFLAECLALKQTLTGSKDVVEAEENLPITPTKTEERKIIKARKNRSKNNEELQGLEKLKVAETDEIEEGEEVIKKVDDAVIEEMKKIEENEDVEEAAEVVKNIDINAAVVEKAEDDVKGIEEVVEAAEEVVKKIEEIIEEAKEVVKEEEEKEDRIETAEEVVEDLTKAENEVKLSREFLLASSARGGPIFIWRAGSDGRQQLKLASNSRKQQYNKKYSYNDKNFITLCWITPTVLLSSGGNGELFRWDLLDNDSNNGLQSKLIHNDHATHLFSIAAPIKLTKEINMNLEENKHLVAWTAGKDRMVFQTSLDSEKKILSCYPTLGNSVLYFCISPVDANRIAIGLSDGSIRIWDLSRPHLQNISMSQIKIKSNLKMLTLAWHPTNENTLAFGTDDGRIGLVYTNNITKPPTLLIHHFRRAVYCLEWGPFKGYLGLYVCAEGSVAVYNIEKPLETPQILQFDSKEYITQLAWKPDHSMIVFGSKNGVLTVCDEDLHVIGCLYYQKKSIETFCWHPQATEEDEEISQNASWLASTTTTDPTIVVYDLKNFTKDNIDVSKRIICELSGHTKQVHRLFWSPYEGGKLCSVSEDGTAMVWSVKDSTKMSTFININTDPITAGIWSPLDRNYIITAGRESTIQIWNICDHPPKSPDEILCETNKRRKQIRSIVNSKMNSKKTDLSCGDDKKKVVRDVLLTSVALRQREIQDVIQDCKQLLNSTQDEEKGKNPVQKLLGDQKDINCLLQNQYEHFKSVGKPTSSQNIALLSGNIAEAIKEGIEKGHLSPWLISLAPMVSPKLWQEACLAYALKLSENPKCDPMEVCSYYLACHEVEKAIEALCAGGLYREALALAKSRLPSNSNLITDVLERWSNFCLQNGRFELAAQCYISLGKIDEAAKALYKRSDFESISLALELAQKCGSTELEAAIKFRYDSFKQPEENEDIKLVCKFEAIVLSEMQNDENVIGESNKEEAEANLEC